jgi:hypothetical protein
MIAALSVFTVFETRDKARATAKEMSAKSVEFTYKVVNDHIFDKWMILIIDHNGYVVGNV